MRKQISSIDYETTHLFAFCLYNLRYLYSDLAWKFDIFLPKIEAEAIY